MQRLTVEDMLMLWPDEAWPQEVGAVGVLDGSLIDADGALRIDAVRRSVEARLHLAPRLRQVLRTPGRGLGRPLWVDDPAFDVAHHVRAVPLPQPAGEAELVQAVERLRRRRLDRSRPLWEMWLLPGLPGGRVGFYMRLHHAIADGIAAIATLGVFLDMTPQHRTAPASPWDPQPPPGAGALLADNLRAYAVAGIRSLARLVRPVRTVRGLRAGWRSMRAGFDAVPTPSTSLNRTVGQERAVAVVRGELASVRRIAHVHGATVNDVLLAFTAAGLRTLLRGRGETVERLPVYVPATLRPADQWSSARGNHIAQMMVALPLGTTDPVRRLRQIAMESARQKAKPHPPLGAVLRSRTARRILLSVLDRHPVSVTTADLIGPDEPRYLAGARLLDVFPLAPLIGNVTVAVAALSYAGRFTVAVVADPVACPDVNVLAAAVQQEWTALA
ncbi:MAG: wax ester/triacylglycerol synthase family O-acyltransferase, partial [Catenulispora sp.]|nr:wax ester/triacylglycerol synthase family O-acyltransferase [Catenulispora sp.]